MLKRCVMCLSDITGITKRMATLLWNVISGPEAQICPPSTLSYEHGRSVSVGLF